MAHPTRLLQDLVHQRVRLGILVALSAGHRLGFTTLRDMLGQPDSGLSRHLGVLEGAGMVATEKVIEDNRQKTWVSLTEVGRHALRAELAALRSMMEGIAETPEAGDLELFAALLGDRPQRERKPGLTPAELILPDGPEGFEVLRDLPIDDQFQLSGVRDWGSAEAQRLAFRSHGLTGGHLRSWVRDGERSAHIMLVELGGAQAPPAIVGCFAPSTLNVPDIPENRGYLLHRGGQLPVAAVCWFWHGRHLLCVTARGEEETAKALCRETAQRQFRRIDNANPYLKET
ncbi:transcriptional regulator [Fodinicola acaciae]|uniref:transcriptional regulator n=1 Tax=Fodinicola acaciae TaxID=2681555 RepID=UPI0013D3E394|nr:transcriptional regulator [Fodinicola acaciae]